MANEGTLAAMDSEDVASDNLQSLWFPLSEPRPAFGVVKSISDDEDEILLGIMRLHNNDEPFELDVTYSRGGLYRGRVPIPRLRFDIGSAPDITVQADVTALPLRAASIGSVVCDLPFMFNPHGSALRHSKANGRYTMFPAWVDLERIYQGMMRGALRTGHDIEVHVAVPDQRSGPSPPCSPAVMSDG